MTNLFGIDTKPLLEKLTEFTIQQRQIITLLTNQNQLQQQTNLLLEQIQQQLMKYVQ